MNTQTYIGPKKGFRYAHYDGKFWEQQLRELGNNISPEKWYSEYLDFLHQLSLQALFTEIKSLFSDPLIHKEPERKLVEVTLDDMLTPLQTQTQEDGSFVINGVNDSARIVQLSELTGLPICELERRMLPDDRNMYAIKKNEFYGSNSGFGGFLKPEEQLLAILREDNDYVRSQGLTHQDIAKPLFQILNSFLKAIKKDAKPWDTFYFHKEGKTYGFREFGFPMGQCCPFNDGIVVPGRNFSVIKFEGEPYVLNRDNQNQREINRFAWLHPYMISRYGFYEGNVEFRKDPEKLIEFFGLKPSQ